MCRNLNGYRGLRRRKLGHTRRAMRIGLAVVVLALGLALLGSAAAPGGESRQRATLKLSAGIPLTLRGTHFRPNERVRVTLAGELRRTKRVTAGRAGGFVVRFEAAYDRCSGAIASAVGARGSRATLKLPPLGCPVPP
jgi:hypothetical protein